MEFVSRETIRGKSSTPYSHWELTVSEGRFRALTGTEHSTCELVDLSTGKTINLQKQEIITQFLAGGDAEAAHMIMLSWYSTVEDEIAKLLPGGVLENPDFSLNLGAEIERNPRVKSLVAEKVSKALLDEHVERALKAIEHSAEGGLPGSWRLDEFLEREFEEKGFIVDGLMKYGSNVHVVASAKTGKTNVAINLVRALADGGLFLGVFETQPIKGRICILDFELDERQAQDWFKRIGIKNKAKVEIYPLRGQPNPFRSRESMQELEEVLKLMEIEFLILDPFSSVFEGDGNSNTEVKKFLREIDSFKLRSGVKHLVVAVHAGRNSGQTRGASTLDDHPDALWYLQKVEDKRFFRAVGRDVEVAEAEISFNTVSGEVTYHSSRKKADPRRIMMVKILRFVQENDGCTATEIDSAVSGSNTHKSAARKGLIAAGVLIESKESRGRKSYKLGAVPEDLQAQL